MERKMNETIEEKTYRLCVKVLAEQHPKVRPLPIDDPGNDKDAVRFYNRLVELAIAEEREACAIAVESLVKNEKNQSVMRSSINQAFIFAAIKIRNNPESMSTSHGADAHKDEVTK